MHWCTIHWFTLVHTGVYEYTGAQYTGALWCILWLMSGIHWWYTDAQCTGSDECTLVQTCVDECTLKIPLNQFLDTDNLITADPHGKYHVKADKKLTSRDPVVNFTNKVVKTRRKSISSFQVLKL